MKKISAVYRRQTGAALLVVMVIVLLVSLLAVFATRGTILQEKMSQAVIAQNHTLQAAESGIVQAEYWLASNPTPVFKVVTNKYASYGAITECEAGICAMSVPSLAGRSADNTHFWAKADFWEQCVTKNQCIEGEPVGKWNIKPRYVIEDYGYSNDNPGGDLMQREALNQFGSKLMRITAWSEFAGSHSIAQAIVVKRRR